MGIKLDAFNGSFGISYKKPYFCSAKTLTDLNLGKLLSSLPIFGIIFAVIVIRQKPETGRRLFALRGFIYGFGLLPIGIALDLFASLTTQVHNAVTLNRRLKKL